MAVFVLLEAFLFSLFLARSGATGFAPEPLSKILVGNVTDFCYNPDPLVRRAIHCHKIDESKAKFDAQNVKREKGSDGIVLFAKITPPASGLLFNELQLRADDEDPKPVKIDTPTEVAVKFHFDEAQYQQRAKRFFDSLHFYAQTRPFYYSLVLAASNIGPPQYQLVKEGEVKPLFSDYAISGKIEGLTVHELIREMRQFGSYEWPHDKFLSLGNMVSIPLAIAEALDFTMPKGLWHCGLHPLNVMWMKADAKECKALRRAGSLRVWESKKSGFCFIFDPAYVRIIDTEFMIKVNPLVFRPCGKRFRPNDLFEVVKLLSEMEDIAHTFPISVPSYMNFFYEYEKYDEICEVESAAKQNEWREHIISNLKGVMQKFMRDKHVEEKGAEKHTSPTYEQHK